MKLFLMCTIRMSPFIVCTTQVLEGFNVSIFAYGQTGSGKTWTMVCLFT